MLNRGLKGCVYLDGIVSAEAQARKLVVGKVLDHAQKAGIAAEQVLPEIGAALNKKFLILPVGDLAQALHQQTVAIVLKQAVPIRAPDDFDDVPSRAAEDGFEFLNNFSVAAHRAVQPLQVTVDDPDQIVELLARSQRDRSQGLWLVHFAVAEESPNLAAGAGFQPAILQILDKARVVDGLDW